MSKDYDPLENEEKYLNESEPDFDSDAKAGFDESELGDPNDNGEEDYEEELDEDEDFEGEEFDDAEELAPAPDREEPPSH